jgi:hypothetical protein
MRHSHRTAVNARSKSHSWNESSPTTPSSSTWISLNPLKASRFWQASHRSHLRNASTPSSTRTSHRQSWDWHRHRIRYFFVVDLASRALVVEMFADPACASFHRSKDTYKMVRKMYPVLKRYPTENIHYSSPMNRDSRGKVTGWVRITEDAWTAGFKPEGRILVRTLLRSVLDLPPTM